MCHRCGGCEEKSCQEKAASFEGEEAAGKGRLPTLDRQKTPRCPPAASPGSALGPGFPPLPPHRTRSSNPGAARRPPRSRSQPPTGSGNPLQPGPGAQSSPAGLPEQPLGALGGRPPAPSPTTFPLPPGPRFDLDPPPATPHAHAGPGPPAGPTRTPGPADNEQPQLTSSARAPWVRGRFLSPFSFPLSSDQERYPAAGRRPPTLPSLPREPPPPPGRRPRSLPEESHFIPRSNMAAPPAAAAAVALPRLPAAGERPQAVLGSRPLGRRRCRERRGWPRVGRAGPRGCEQKRRPEPDCASPLRADASARSQRGGSH
ncbi:basic proline-rich protein-like [Caloenas nicobarica]|uniref:basic proline-rich protein-like n=1 Tax=Caloenas nicobarica TaxID=187106 RepID=UPI0032B85C8D